MLFAFVIVAIVVLIAGVGPVRKAIARSRQIQQSVPDCKGNFMGADCDQCKPNFMGADCKQCKGNFVGDKCDQCKGNFVGDKCDQCKGNFVGDKCDQCKPNFMGAKCDQCKENFVGADCNQCKGNFAGADCNQCKGNFVGDKCDQCKPNFVGADCNQCKGNFMGADCDQCKGNFMGVDCDQCKPGYESPLCKKCKKGYGSPDGKTCDYQAHLGIDVPLGYIDEDKLVSICTKVGDIDEVSKYCNIQYGANASYLKANECSRPNACHRGKKAHGCVVRNRYPWDSSAQALCTLDTGFWGPIGADYADYDPCAFDHQSKDDCASKLPEGFAGVVE